jgi:hypothetical protein
MREANLSALLGEALSWETRPSNWETRVSLVFRVHLDG